MFLSPIIIAFLRCNSYNDGYLNYFMNKTEIS